MEYFGVLITALFLTCVVGSPTNCSETYQRLMEEAATVKESCDQASMKDCCQVNIMHLNIGNTFKILVFRSKSLPHGLLLAAMK